MLQDEARGLAVPESSIIIGYLQHHHPGRSNLIPGDPDFALRANALDRIFDNYVSMSLTKVGIDRLRPEDRRDPLGVEEAKALIETAYGLLDRELLSGGWAVGESFTLADCAAAPALFYTNTAVPFGDHSNLAAYYRKLLGRASVARVVKEARPYRHLFPLEWPAGYD